MKHRTDSLTRGAALALALVTASLAGCRATDTTAAAPTAAAEKCPVMGAEADPTYRHTAAGAMDNGDWWPNQLNLKLLHANAPARPRALALALASRRGCRG